MNPQTGYFQHTCNGGNLTFIRSDGFILKTQSNSVHSCQIKNKSDVCGKIQFSTKISLLGYLEHTCSRQQECLLPIPPTAKFIADLTPTCGEDFGLIMRNTYTCIQGKPIEYITIKITL